MEKKKICVLFGGASSEHEVSLMSATSVLTHMPTEKYEPVMVGITKSGHWLRYAGPICALKDGSWEKHPSCTPAFLSPDPSVHGLVLLQDGKTEIVRVDAVFPVLHGRFGEDGTVQGLLEMAQIPYVGCCVLASAVCMDKIVADLVMDAAGIPRCEWDWMRCGEELEPEKLEERICQKLGYPVFVKPANAGSSVGITKAHNKAEFLQAVKLALSHDSRVLFERAVDGQEVALTPVEYKIVKFLMENRGLVFSSAQIYEIVWNEPSYGADNIVAVHIRHIREKIEINPKEPRYIKVIWGHGYKMEKL